MGDSIDKPLIRADNASTTRSWYVRPGLLLVVVLGMLLLSLLLLLVLHRSLGLDSHYVNLYELAEAMAVGLVLSLPTVWLLNMALRSRVRAERAQQALQTLFDVSPDPAGILDGGRFVDCNRTALEIFQFADREQLLGVQPGRLSPSMQPDGEDSLVKAERMIALAMQTGMHRFEWVHKRIDNSEFLAEVTLCRVQLTDHPVVYCAWRDITQARDASRQLRESEARLRTLIDSLPDPVWLKDTDGAFLACNARFTRLYGASEQQIVGKTDYDFVDKELADFFRFHDLKAMQADGPSINEEEVVYADDGHRETLETIKVALRDSDGELRGVLGVARDISQRKQMADELAASESRFRAIFEGAYSGIAIADRETQAIIDANPAMCRMLAYPREQLLGTKVEKLHFGEMAETIKALFENGGATLSPLLEEVPTVRRDGTMLLVDITVSRIFVEGRVCLMGFFRDVSKRREAQQARLAQQRAEAIAEAKGLFLANMSHEIRTPLNGVLGLARIGAKQRDVEAMREAFMRICESGKQLLLVVNDVLDFSKIEAGELVIAQRTFELRPLLQRLVRLYGSMREAEGLEVLLQCDDRAPAWIRGDDLRLEQILGNLMSNAIKFTAHGRVQLSATAVARGVEFRVADSGIGMSETQLEELFRPFQQADASTTRRYGGTGLGLAISRNLAKLMGGDIRAQSELDKGSTFIFYLPLPAAEVLATEAVTPAEAVSSPTGFKPRLVGLHLLAAEDVAVNRVILEDLLLAEGAEVTFADNGRHAVELFRSEGGEQAFDAVLMDIQMPVMDGYEATELILKQAPDMPVIGLTAHALISEREHSRQVGMRDHVTKPIDIDELVASIRRNCRLPKASAD